MFLVNLHHITHAVKTTKTKVQRRYPIESRQLNWIFVAGSIGVKASCESDIK